MFAIPPLFSIIFIASFVAFSAFLILLFVVLIVLFILFVFFYTASAKKHFVKTSFILVVELVLLALAYHIIELFEHFCVSSKGRKFDYIFHYTAKITFFYGYFIIATFLVDIFFFYWRWAFDWSNFKRTFRAAKNQ